MVDGYRPVGAGLEGGGEWQASGGLWRRLPVSSHPCGCRHEHGQVLVRAAHVVRIGDRELGNTISICHRHFRTVLARQKAGNFIVALGLSSKQTTPDSAR